jgi:hypothetical protein
MKDMITQIYGWPIIVIMTSIFIINFLLCRYITAKLLKRKILTKKSPEYQKAFLMWFFPIIGFLGLLMLLWIHKIIKFSKSFIKWLLLSHV